MKKTVLAFAVLLTGAAFISCKKETPVTPQKANTPDGNIRIIDLEEESPCPATTVTLVAGQHYNAGSVKVTNDADYIYVTYTAENGYLLTQTHLFAGACNAVPVNNSGNPMPGMFPYKTTHSYATSYTYQLPISAISAGNCGCIAAHAVVVKLGANGEVVETQTGWGNGIRINPNGGNWGMKFDYCSCTP
jgi:hypothetical protein